MTLELESWGRSQENILFFWLKNTCSHPLTPITHWNKHVKMKPKI